MTMAKSLFVLCEYEFIIASWKVSYGNNILTINLNSANKIIDCETEY